jgi:hypothetical protein
MSGRDVIGNGAARMADIETYTPEQRQAMAAERKEFARQVVDRFARDFLAAAEAKADRERRAGRWDDLKQLRLDGLRDFIGEVEDFDLKFMGELSHTHGLHFDFALDDRTAGVSFTDTGPVALA